MEWMEIRLEGGAVRMGRCNTAVVGSGAAGLNAALRLRAYGERDAVVVTDGLELGTSRNTGSDKQTYYKLTLAGEEPDSVGEMARTLFQGGAVDGDNALAEAALSAPCFLRLADRGVPFPVNRYGEYVGYKTDHDPRRRATSAGPLTSRLMTEALERGVKEGQIPILDGFQAVRILTAEGEVRGLLCLNREGEYRLLECRNIIWATGGPAGMYADSAYPACHLGDTGAAFLAGAGGQNLTEWQFGIASLAPRWNVSGTYMQALPRFFSTDENGGDSRDFLAEAFPDPGDLLDRVFLKGYQWPFDVRKAAEGSSLLDLLVYRERVIRGRRVYLDYRANPLGGKLDPSLLGQEAREYLERAGAFLRGGAEPPFQRLAHMNLPAVEFYRGRGVDLEREPLEIALCAQHNNGGLGVDAWWQTTVKGLFAAGEAAGTHGVYRPGGSALNAGQAGSDRAARYIAAHRRGEAVELPASCLEEAGEAVRLGRLALESEGSADGLWRRAQREMSRVGGPIRDREEMALWLRELEVILDRFPQGAGIESPRELGKLHRLHHMLTCQRVYLGAMLDYADRRMGSRGSALYRDSAGSLPLEDLPERFRFRPDGGAGDGIVQEARPQGVRWAYSWRKVRPIPREEDFFENVWRSFREHGNVH